MVDINTVQVTSILGDIIKMKQRKEIYALLSMPLTLLAEEGLQCSVSDTFSTLKSVFVDPRDHH